MKWIVLMFALAMMMAPVPAHAAGDRAAGLQLVRQWCTSCHQVEAGGHRNEVAPAFMSIANNPLKTPDKLRNWLIAPHPPMPNFNLSRRAIDNIIAYLASLKGK